MNVYYAKTALYAYPNIEAIVAQIDELVEKRALSSINDYSSAISQCEKIIDYTIQKDALFALKLYLQDVLATLSNDQLDCLEYKYFKRKPKEYFIGFDFESRAYFRKQNKIARLVAQTLDKNGATDLWFETNCLTMDFFKELLKRTVEHEKSYNKKGAKKKNTAKPVLAQNRLSA